MLIADTLSRLVEPGRDQGFPGLNINITSVMSINPTRLERLQEETKSDPYGTSMANQDVWPDTLQDLSQELQPFWCVRDELFMLNRFTMKRNILLVPTAVHEDPLHRLHETVD